MLLCPFLLGYIDKNYEFAPFFQLDFKKYVSYNQNVNSLMSFKRTI
jgi:hypothetical protein